MAKTKNKKFVSIGKKIVTAVVLFVFIFTAVFSLYIYFSMRENAKNRYEQQVVINAEVSGKNIDHYIGSMITATKSVYINHTLMNFLKNSHGKQLEEHEGRITEYFKSVYYASAAASQIYLVLPEEDLSILYKPRLLKFYSGGIDASIEIPEMQSYGELYVESTHVKTDYGHNVPAIERYPENEQVITIWLPISDLPASTKPIAYMAIDLPIAFITENCSMVYAAGEIIYVVDQDNMIIASNDQKAQMNNFLDYYPRYHRTNLDSSLLKYENQLLAETGIDSKYFDWSIIKVTPLRSVYALTTGQMVSMLLLFAALILMFLAATSMQILKYVRSLRRITEYMEKERENQSWEKRERLSEYMQYHEKDEISSLIDSFQRLMDSLKEHAIQKYEWKLAYTRSELRAMQAQINPHFIYNVIQCFATNSLKDHNMKQYEMISSFGQMLHYAMVLEPSMVPADKAIEYVGRYIALQEMRFGKQLSMVYEIEPALVDFKIPKMSIQPLVENSITHGNLMKRDGGSIKLKLDIVQGKFHLLVEDNGVPVSDDTIQSIYHKMAHVRQKLMNQEKPAERKRAALEYSVREDENHNHFIGLENVFSRLLLSFGDCDFLIYTNERNGTSVEFLIPMEGRLYQEVER